MRARQKRFCRPSDELARGFSCAMISRHAERGANHARMHRQAPRREPEREPSFGLLEDGANNAVRCLDGRRRPTLPANGHDVLANMPADVVYPATPHRSPLLFQDAAVEGDEDVCASRHDRSPVPLLRFSPRQSLAGPKRAPSVAGCGGACLDVRRRAQMQLRIWVEQALQPRRIDARALPAVCMEHNQRSAAPKRRGMRPGARGRALLLQLQRPVDSSRQAVVEVAATQEHDPDHGRARGKYVRQVHHGQQRACGTPRSLAPKRRAAILGAREDRAREDGDLVGRLVVRVPHSNVRRNELFRPRVVTCSRCTGQRGNPGPRPHQTWGG